MSLTIGVIFDTIGRKIPFAISLILSVSAYLMYPIFKSVTLYYIISLMTVMLTVMKTLPFVPDLIK